MRRPHTIKAALSYTNWREVEKCEAMKNRTGYLLFRMLHTNQLSYPCSPAYFWPSSCLPTKSSSLYFCHDLVGLLHTSQPVTYWSCTKLLARTDLNPNSPLKFKEPKLVKENLVFDKRSFALFLQRCLQFCRSIRITQKLRLTGLDTNFLRY